jgi:tripeptide aminopeptidase
MDSIDAIVIGGPSHIDLDIDITGKAAHSGMEPEKGISAIKAAACAIVVANLGRIDDATTANVGTIRGGSVRNAIPDRVHIEAEVRSLDHDTCVRVSDTMADVFRVAAAAQGAHAEVTCELGYRAYSIDRDTPLVDIATAALRHAGIEPRIARITGGLESAVYHEHGINVLPLGNGARAEHTVDEHIHVEDMERIVEVIRFLFDRFSDRDLDDLATTAAQGSP